MSTNTASQDIVDKFLAGRSEKTKATYGGPQKMYIEWCRVRFGNEKACGSRMSEYCSSILKNLKGGHGQPLGASSMKNHISSIVDLFHFQQATENPLYVGAIHPRTAAVKQFLATYIRDEDNRRKDERIDRGIGTVRDGYSLTEHARLVQNLLVKNTFESLRTRADHLIGDAMLFRGDERREADLCDLYSLTMHQSESDMSPEKLLVIVSRQGKLNKCGRIEYGSALRHRNPELCPVGGLFLYLFIR